MILHTVNGIEQRQHPRAEIRWPVTMRPSTGAMKGETLNVSSTGAFIKCSKPLEFNQVFILDIDVPTLVHPLKAMAEVVWSNREEIKTGITLCGMGIRFLKISSKDRRFIVKAVQEHLNSDNVQTIPLEAFRTTAVD